MPAKFTTKDGPHAMEPDKLAELPFWFQVIAGAGLFVGTAAIAALGWAKKNFASGLLNGKEDDKNAVVLSASIADSKSIARLAEAIENLCVQIRRNDAQDTEAIYQLRRDHRDLIDEMSRLTRAIQAKGLIL